MISADPGGFRLRAAADSGGGTLSFNASRAEWSSQPAEPGQSHSESTTRRCKRLTAVPASVSALNGVPLEYLLLRPWPLAILNPSLHQSDLRLALARVIAGRTGSAYSTYKLLAPVPRSAPHPRR